MIKHRFILRGEDDFRVFAAIPVERTVLKWEKWVKPPDWLALETLLQRAHKLLTEQSKMWATAATRYRVLADAREAMLAQEYTRLPAEDVCTFNAEIISYKDSAETLEKREEDTKNDAAIVAGAITANGQHDFNVACTWLADEAERELDPRLSWRGSEYTAIIEMVGRKEREIHRVLSMNGRPADGAVAKWLRVTSQQTIKDAYDAVLASPWKELATAAEELAAGPPDATVCPEGVPFACYTVEFNGLVVDVVEGCAWLHEATEAEVKQKVVQLLRTVPTDSQRKILDNVEASLEGKSAPLPPTLTDADKRVVEIVSQMLTERALNPKADTRIPVVPVDPAHERAVHAAEEKDARTPPNETRLRTIKFTVSPPRYLRAAAERILASTRRAHWVVGHWRDQAYGTAHQLRRQTWIKPHIRGLGEASAIVAKVAAPDEKVAAAHATHDDRKQT